MNHQPHKPQPLDNAANSDALGLATTMIKASRFQVLIVSILQGHVRQVVTQVLAQAC